MGLSLALGGIVPALRRRHKRNGRASGRPPRPGWAGGAGRACRAALPRRPPLC